MFCVQCGKELPASAATCPACGSLVSAAPTGKASSGPVDQMVAEAKRAAKDLIAASARISKYAIDRAESAGKDPSGTARRAAKRVAKELDNAAREVDRILRDL